MNIARILFCGKNTAPRCLSVTLVFLVVNAGLLRADGYQDQTEAYEDQIGQALQGYYIEFGFLPQGKSLDVFRALTGGNPRKVVFIELPAKYVDANGRFLDAWGTPYLIKFTGGKTFEIRSAGPDKQFGTKDDMVLTKTLKM